MQRIAIVGAAGFSAERLAPQLLYFGHALRCPVRPRAKLEGRVWILDSRVEIQEVIAQMRHRSRARWTYVTRHFSWCIRCCRPRGEYAQRDQQLALSFGCIAPDAGVGRIIYLGGLGEPVRISASISLRGMTWRGACLYGSAG
jgi:putative NADH-flavin reductase